jgi:hypothetical protein
MPREVDERKTRKALSRLQRARAEAEARGETFSEWESEFVESVETRLKTFGSAFADPEKGDLSEPLSGRQRVKVREIDRKARGRDRPAEGPSDEAAETGISAPARAAKQRKPLRARKPMNRGKGFAAKGKAFTPRVRDIAEDVPEEERSRPSGPPKLRLIDGGGD